MSCSPFYVQERAACGKWELVMKKYKEKLQCMQATKMIPAFITGELSYKELEQFMGHLEECENCREELSIQFLVDVGLNSLEAGNTFDLQEELHEALEEAEGKVQLYRFLRQGLFILGCVAGAAVLVLGLLLILNFV